MWWCFMCGWAKVLNDVEDAVPDSLRFLIVVAVLAGAVYGSVWALAHFPPEQSEIVKALPHEKLRQK
jgi:hypothetical protein